MSCPTFQRWLAAGMPDSAAVGAQRHADRCPACAGELAATLEVERLLEQPAIAPAPRGFADRVMASVARAPTGTVSARSRRIPALRPVLPWWLEIAANPLVAGATILAGLLLWFRAEVWSLASGLAARLTEPPASAVPLDLASPEAAIGIALALLPLAWMAARVCQRSTERLLVRGAVSPSRRSRPGSDVGSERGPGRDPARR